MAALVTLAGCDPTSLGYLENGERRDAAIVDAPRGETAMPDPDAPRLDTRGDAQVGEIAPAGLDANVEAGVVDVAADGPSDSPVAIAQDGGGLDQQGEAGGTEVDGGAWDTAALAGEAGLPGLDGGSGEAGDLRPDRGIDTADVPRGCRGVADSGVCWYLGRSSESCATACADHGGTSAAAASHVGTSSQGGSARECHRLLNLLTLPGLEVTDSRSDDEGLGCYVSALGLHVWLSSPAYTASAKLLGAQPLCGCLE